MGTPQYTPTVGQLAAAEELLGVQRFNQLCSLEEIDATQREILALYAIVTGKSVHEIADTPIDTARAEVAFFFSVSLARLQRVRESYPVFLLLSIQSEQIEAAISRVSSIFPGMETEAGAALDTLLQRVSTIIRR